MVLLRVYFLYKNAKLSSDENRLIGEFESPDGHYSLTRKLREHGIAATFVSFRKLHGCVSLQAVAGPSCRGIMGCMYNSRPRHRRFESCPHPFPLWEISILEPGVVWYPAIRTRRGLTASLTWGTFRKERSGIGLPIQNKTAITEYSAAW